MTFIVLTNVYNAKLVRVNPAFIRSMEDSLYFDADHGQRPFTSVNCGDYKIDVKQTQDQILKLIEEIK